MSGFVAWIGAQGDERDGKLSGKRVFKSANACEDGSGTSSWQRLPVHDFPTGRRVCGSSPRPSHEEDLNPDLWMYRQRTVGLLRRYLRLSLETGRLPSIVGREMFRAKVSAYRATTFEDRVIFVRDVEKCIERLEYWDQQLIARVVLQEHNQAEAAHMLHCTRKTVQRRVPEVLDQLSGDFLRCGLLNELPERGRERH